MKKIKIAVENDITFEKDFEKYLVNCKARNLRDEEYCEIDGTFALAYTNFQWIFLMFSKRVHTKS